MLLWKLCETFCWASRSRLIGNAHCVLHTQGIFFKWWKVRTGAPIGWEADQDLEWHFHKQQQSNMLQDPHLFLSALLQKRRRRIVVRTAPFFGPRPHHWHRRLDLIWGEFFHFFNFQLKLTWEERFKNYFQFQAIQICVRKKLVGP